jgi:tetratricopeptide (TPR) repeat protein
MFQRNTVIVVSVVGGALLIALVIAYFGQPSLEKGEFDKGQRFTAKPGTTRENAMILTSANRATTQDPKDAIARQADHIEKDDDPLEVKSLSTRNIDARSGPANDVAESARNNISPEAGLRQLEAALALPHNQEQAALLHEARGELFAQLDPPDFAQAQTAFEKALEMTTDVALEEEIRHKAVQALMQAGQDAEALELATAQLSEHPPGSRAGYKLQLLKGQLEERAGRLAEAEREYRAVLEAMESAPESLGDEEALSLARLSVLRLTQLYRHTDRNEEVEQVAGVLRKQVARIHGDGQH